MIQERLDELGSAIVNYKNNKIELIGFYSPDMLLLGENSLNNFLSHGIYKLQNINFFKIKDNFILVIKENNIEKSRYQFKKLHSDILDYYDFENKKRSKLYKIRKCQYTNLYNYIDADISEIFKTKQDLDIFIENLKNMPV